MVCSGTDAVDGLDGLASLGEKDRYLHSQAKKTARFPAADDGGEGRPVVEVD